MRLSLNKEIELLDVIGKPEKMHSKKSFFFPNTPTHKHYHYLYTFYNKTQNTSRIYGHQQLQTNRKFYLGYSQPLARGLQTKRLR